MSRKIIVMAIIFNVCTFVHGWGIGHDIDEGSGYKRNEEEEERKRVFHGLYTNLTRECFSPGRICLFGADGASGTVLLGGWPVCHEDWDIKEAAVACRSLGFAGASNATRLTDFDLEDRFSDFYAMKNVQGLAITYQYYPVQF